RRRSRARIRRRCRGEPASRCRKSGRHSGQRQRRSTVEEQLDGQRDPKRRGAVCVQWISDWEVTVRLGTQVLLTNRQYPTYPIGLLSSTAGTVPAFAGFPLPRAYVALAPSHAAVPCPISRTQSAIVCRRSSQARPLPAQRNTRRDEIRPDRPPILEGCTLWLLRMALPGCG